MDDTNLSNLDLSSAREYILAFATDAKRYEKDIAQAEAELALWKSRIALAEQKAQGELAEAARSKAAQASEKLSVLIAEKASLDSKVEAMKGQLSSIRARERGINSDQLLAELQLMTGDLLEPNAAKTEKDIAALEKTSATESALVALKRKMAGQ